MSAVSAAPSVPAEEWNDDFDLGADDPLVLASHADKAETEDWDVEMDLGRTGGAKMNCLVSEANSAPTTTATIRLPIMDIDECDMEEDEGVSTIKVVKLPKLITTAIHAPVDEDLESDFAIPSGLTQLSLAPKALHHQTSKSSLEWSDRDHTSSSTSSSDAYSTLGFADVSPSSNYTSAASVPESGTDEEEEGDLDGLVIPTGLFESAHESKKLLKHLERKKVEGLAQEPVKVSSPDPEDDFEQGLVIEDDEVLTPSRLVISKKEAKRACYTRSKSAPSRAAGILRPPSRLKTERAKSPSHPPPTASTRQLAKTRLTPSPPRPSPPARSATAQSSQSSASPTSPNDFLSPRSTFVRQQKSHSALKSLTPSSSRKAVTRKASMSSLMEGSSKASASGSSPSPPPAPPAPSGYDAPTAASRAKSHTASTSRMRGLEYVVPPTRPSTPSSNPAAIRLTLPTTMRLRSRPSILSVFPSPVSTAAPSASATPRAISPSVPRPPSSLSSSTRARIVSGQRTTSPPKPQPPKMLRKPKRQRLYGDGTELDAFEDLPTDWNKEGRYRVTPKGYGNRVPGGSYSAKQFDSSRGPSRQTSRQSSAGSDFGSTLSQPTISSLRRSSGNGDPSKPSGVESSSKRKKLTISPSGQTKRKPTLIRNLGGADTAKVVGEMKWNPKTLRWEGNDQALRDFDTAVASSRPALITQLTGSSFGSPVNSFANGARMVGNMIFDPSRMCWISSLHPDEEEPDVFADLADDEDDDDWDAKGGTIKANIPTKPTLTSSRGAVKAATVRIETPSPANSHKSARSDCASDRCSRASMVCDVDDKFMESCQIGEARHCAEMRAWRGRATGVFATDDKSYLYEIRALATRKY